MKAKFSLLLASILVIGAIPAYAHHSFAAEFDGTKPVRLVGKNHQRPVDQSALLLLRRRHRR